MTSNAFLVHPEALRPSADRCDQVGQQLDAVSRTLAGLTAVTGRCDSTAALEAAADELSTAVTRLARAAHGDALRLRAAAEGYATAERRASGY